MTILPKLGVRVVSLKNPIPEKKDAFESITPKLTAVVNNYSLKEKTEIPGASKIIKTADASSDYENLHGYAVVNFDSGEVLAEKNISQKIPIASLTKLMTAVVALDLAKPADTFTVTSSAESVIPTKLGLIPGQKVTLEELLNGMLLTSANDAAALTKEGVEGEYGADTFIQSMNEKAKAIGLKNTSFANPQGFDNQKNYSTPRDLAILTHYALTNYPLIASIVKKDYQFYPANADHKQMDLYNWNGLLDVYPGAEGVKIGNTDDAGYTTIVVSQRERKTILAVSLGAPGVIERDLWTSQLLDLGFQKYGIEGANINETQLKAKYATWKYFQ